MAMYNCISKCICAECNKIYVNCAECQYSVNKTKECLNGGIKKCKHFSENKNKRS